jgi:hypothetical protein
MLILILIGAMLIYARPEPWSAMNNIVSEKTEREPRPLGPRICTGAQCFGMLRARPK